MAEGATMARATWLLVAAMTVPGCTASVRAHEISGNVPAAARSMPSAPEPLAVRVYPTVAAAQSDAWVNVRVERDRRSVSLVIAWQSEEGGGGSHLITLEGANAAVRHQYPIRGLDAGDYRITAVLTREDGTSVERTTRLVVTGFR
jgi:hypothetical protein